MTNVTRYQTSPRWMSHEVRVHELEGQTIGQISGRKGTFVRYTLRDRQNVVTVVPLIRRRHHKLLAHSRVEPVLIVLSSSDLRRTQRRGIVVQVQVQVQVGESPTINEITRESTPTSMDKRTTQYKNEHKWTQLKKQSFLLHDTFTVTLLQDFLGKKIGVSVFETHLETCTCVGTSLRASTNHIYSCPYM